MRNAGDLDGDNGQKMRRYLLSLIKILMINEKKYGIYALIIGLFLSVLAWIPFIAIAATLSFEFAIGGELAMVCVLMLFSPAVILFYVSFALLADEVFGYLTGRAVFGMQPGSLKRKIRQMVGV
ncbi:hypothetical protein HFO98_17440 [Rhizobium leguminosarum]|uniref:Uncharacterized protein n=2 Tax=Rhizobium TaxID=379 RepID=A0A179BD67_RHILE|nr:hypothetical protein [Rhizobium leguminosarum]MBY5410218.1 hypothetical protein [Rhizobium leguminosarum]OAP89081.1 hypothetical protein A4U53_33230 [Rhizobium leguminosarum]